MFRNISRMILNRRADLVQKFYKNSNIARVLERFLDDKFTGKILLSDLNYTLQNKNLIIKTNYGIISRELIIYKEELKKKLNSQGIGIQKLIIF